MEVPCFFTFQEQKDFLDKIKKMLTKLGIGKQTLLKVTSSSPAINIGVMGSSKITVKTEVSSPEKVLHLNPEVLCSY